ISFRVHNETPPGAHDVGKSAVMKRPSIVIGTILHVALGAIAPVIEQNDNWVQLVTRDRSHFEASHLKCAVTYKHQRTEFGIGNLRPNCSRDGKAHGS